MSLNQSVLVNLTKRSPYTTLAVLLGTYAAWRKFISWYSLSHIPTAYGSDLPILSWHAAYKFMFNARTITNEAYRKYKGGVYKVSAPDGWKVILCSPQLADEVRRLPDSVLSFHMAGERFIQTEFIISRRVAYDGFANELIRMVLPKKLEAIFPAVCDEIVTALTEILPESSTDWVAVDAGVLTRQVMCRSSNRMLVGLPLCRDPDWVEDNIAFTSVWVLHATIIRPFPRFLKRIIARLVSPVAEKIERAREMLLPTIEHHRDALKELPMGHPDRPDDFMAWMMENDNKAATRTEPQALAEWIKAMNFAAIGTTSTSLQHILYDLAARTKTVEPLREEVQRVITECGWTKTAMSDLVNLDSFMRESMRFNRSSVTATRVCVDGHTFSNGVVVPPGVEVGLATAIMNDEDMYERANEFLPFRFVGNGTHTTPKQFTTVGTDNFVPFGTGRHACPGRFFAALEIKAMLAYIILNYDVTTQVPGGRPQNVGFAQQQIPARNVKLLFRKRQT